MLIFKQSSDRVAWQMNLENLCFSRLYQWIFQCKDHLKIKHLEQSQWHALPHQSNRYNNNDDDDDDDDNNNAINTLPIQLSIKNSGKFEINIFDFYGVLFKAIVKYWLKKMLAKCSEKERKCAKNNQIIRLQKKKNYITNMARSSFTFTFRDAANFPCFEMV